MLNFNTVSMTDYTKATDNLPTEITPVWVRVNGCRPRKMYRVNNWFFYYNEQLDRNGNYCGISKNVLWKYCKQD